MLVNYRLVASLGFFELIPTNRSEIVNCQVQHVNAPQNRLLRGNQSVSAHSVSDFPRVDNFLAGSQVQLIGENKKYSGTGMIHYQRKFTLHPLDLTFL